ncbi:hypothetical protein LCGC14_1205750 [marine sediment metagenome]|uniref:Uncharacterized protein n=1 Tax=marine sediment metagenome TaxID=412755 RepID=A0A0F9LFF3_9ZZZZ
MFEREIRETAKLCTAARGFLDTIDNITTDEFAVGKDQETREKLRQALEEIESET